jgi:ribose transport system substrate-binding protein
LNKKIALVGFDSSGPLQQAVRDGDVEALIVQDPYRMGYLGVWELVQHLEGSNVTPGGKKVESTGEHVVTKENLDAPSTRGLFDPKAQAQRTLKAPEYSK